MDDVSHDGHASQIDLAGYRACRNQWCGELVLVEIARRTGELCTACFQSHLGDQLTQVEVVSRAQRMTMTTTKRARSEHARAKGDKSTKRLTEHARLRALKRLRAVFPDLYDVFYAEERARVGLEPWTIDMTVAPSTDPGCSETLEFARMYHALDQHGVDVDGLEVQPENQDPRPR
jgi:hypothetical protein